MYIVSPGLDPEEVIYGPFHTPTAARTVTDPQPGYTLWRINPDKTADEIGYWNEDREFVRV